MKLPHCLYEAVDLPADSPYSEVSGQDSGKHILHHRYQSQHLKKSETLTIYNQEQQEMRMSSTIAHMTKKEFAQMLSTVVEQKLVELFGDPDDGLALKETLRRRLIRQRKAVAKGERGMDFNSVRKRLGI
jgi:hypothetical protein